MSFGHCSRAPNPYNLSEKYWRYTSNSYRCMPPICNAVPCWLLSLEEREAPQYTSNSYTAVRLLFRAGKANKTINKKTHKHNLHGIIPGLSRDSPGLFLRFPGSNCLCVSLFPLGKKGTHKQFDPHPFPGQSREVVYLYWFLSSPTICTAIRFPFVPAILSRKYQFLGVPEISGSLCSSDSRIAGPLLAASVPEAPRSLHPLHQEGASNSYCSMKSRSALLGPSTSPNTTIASVRT